MEDKKTVRIFLMVLVAIATVVVGYYQYTYEKYNASWGGVNLYICAIPLAVLIALGMNYVNYFIATQIGDGYRFDYKQFTPGPVVYLVMTLACFASIWLGIKFTEPTQEWSSGHSEISHNDRYHYCSFYHYYYGSPSYGGGSGYSSSSSSSSSTSSKDAGKGLAVVVIIVVLFLLLILSGTVQHFWVVASLAILFMLIQFLYREFENEEAVDDFRRRF